MDWILQQSPRLLVCDFPSVDPADRWIDAAIERKLLGAGVPVVYSAANLWLLRATTLSLACLPLAVHGLEAGPTRLVAVEGKISAD